MATYDREQLRIVRAIKHEARQRYKDPSVRKRRVLTAISIGLVETGLHNLNYGDSDSVNFRQERKSIYGGDMNVKRIVGRLFNEMDQHDHGQTRGELAADVQRPREDLRGKYRERMGEAKALRREVDPKGGASARATAGQPGRPGTLRGGRMPQLVLGGEKVDRSGALLAALLSDKKGSLLKRWQGEIATGQYTTTTQSKVVKGKGPKFQPGRLPTAPAAAGQRAPKGSARKGIATFDGKPVMAKFLPELRWARAHGWKGTVTSGVRSKQEQLAAARNFGLQHYGPAGPLGSNHVKGHQGAVDVSDPDGLEAVLRRYRGRRYLRRGMADDPVHFSPTGH